MLFEEDIEVFDDAAKSPICVAVPLKAHFSLKDLWVPAELLINRKKALDSTRNRPNIFHILNHPETESFSVYFEDSQGSSICPTDETNSEQELANFLAFLNKDSNMSHVQKCQNATINTEKQDEKNTKQPKPLLDTLNSESLITIEGNTELPDKENSGRLLDSVNTEKQNEVENSLFEELPIAYQKHFLPDPPTKQKSQKEKKKKNAAKNIQLGDFLQTTNLDGYEIPQRDEFYENLVRQGKCVPVDFPYFTNSPEREFYVSTKWLNLPSDIPKESSSPLSNNACAKPLIEINENDVQSDGVEELENETRTTTLILQNVSCNISKDSIESLMSGYGKLKNVTLETNGKSLKAYVKLILEHDVEWIIECLNGSEPFGASCGTLKCYQLQEI